MRPVRLVPDNTTIQFMRGRFAGVIGSAILSTLSVVLFFYPGLNLGVDFRGGAVVELRGPEALQVDVIREAFARSVSATSECRSLARLKTSWSASRTPRTSRTRSE